MRVTDAGWSIVERAALHALTEQELDGITQRVYDASSSYRFDRVEPWEEEWWTARLPRRGRILVGACGAGREVLWCLGRGYSVEAFDPARSLVALARQRVQGRARIDVAGYSEFIAGSVGIGQFDAIILGWGSLSHVMSADSRAALLATCARICPGGPTLASWLGARDAPSGRSARVGARLGRALGALRGIPLRTVDSDTIYLHIGATHHFDDRELATLCRRAGLAFRPESGSYPHATLTVDAQAAKRAEAAADLVAEALGRGAPIEVVAQGRSMGPAISHGERVSLRALAAHELLTEGDVVAARFQGDLLIHRVVDRDASGRVLLRGDACPAPDGWVERRELLGKVVSVDDGSGPRSVPPCLPPAPRWRRGFGRVGRAWRALR